ncbi:acetyl-CoA hydrolase [Desulfosporosinus orientis DSM 765]|uniref:Acetyl-CoA hydrolase n=1 Tax=Desulfosporosinus orientis (strain ATCC 19365 / DSM 765 / NCIMB 8382 / VKM B-1628 / Singapore I) TaxID=768706 RepID=G7WGT3_DESOD|nr:acetyl-CoA hydrolase/transferase C-terminal domain-containing protein [Desulfosporosinus orientis]AET68519.1 acetyl-CoA hydrolase [Desulfosporosinus orientis DSM 765]
MDVKEQYKSKLMRPEDAVKLVKKGDCVSTPFANGLPVALMNALNARQDLEDVTLYSGTELFPVDAYLPDRNPNLDVLSAFVGPATRTAVAKGRISHVPMRFVQIPEIIRRRIKIDIVMRVVSPMDEHGFFSSGTNADHTLAICKMPTTRHVIVQVSETMPRTWGDNQLHISEVSAVVESTQPLLELPKIPLTQEDRIIGETIADMIEDGSTIQLGIGAIPNAAGKFLKDKRDLGVHTEMFNDAMLDLYEQGAVTCRKKTLKPGKWVATFALGTNRLYKFINDNPLTEIVSCEFTNDPAVIGMNDNMVSINTALEADLTGQVNAESIGPVQYSGPGGFLDFIEGCWRSKGGKSFVALYSTYQDKDRKTRSRIVNSFKPGTIVSGNRCEIDYLVTEYGVALMKGMSVKQRAKNLIAIAHPDFRDELIFYARQQRFID